jgi:ComF family protein
MLKSIGNIFSRFLDLILPPRSDYAIVRKLDAAAVEKLPNSPRVSGLQWIHPLFAYKDEQVRAVVWELKYRGNALPLEHIAPLMYDEIMSVMSDVALFDTDARSLLIPIPITSSRRSERGYNQSEYLAKAILEHDASHTLLYAPQWFFKIKDTPAQSRSGSREERMRNLVGCFQADQRVSGTYVILVDDVTTTGSTLSEARTTLLSAGAKDVYAFTIAH